MADPKYTLRRVGATATPQQGITLANQLRPFFVGPQGAEGDSAYQVAVDAGFVGTPEEWLRSISGAAGELAAVSAAQAQADAVQTGLDRVATGADRVQTGTDRANTGLDRAQTALDRAATTADRAQAGLDAATASTQAANAANSASDALASKNAAAGSATAAASDRVQTALDRVATGADRVQTGLDAATSTTKASEAAASASLATTRATAAAASATSAAADRVQTGLDRVATGSDATASGLSAAAATAQAEIAVAKASEAAAGASAATSSATSAAGSSTSAAASAATASTQAATATSQALNAAASAVSAAASLDSFDDRFLGAKAANPTLDNDGQALLVGAMYWNTTESAMRAWSGTAWIDTNELDGRILADQQLMGAAAYATDMALKGLDSITENRGTFGSTDRAELYAYMFGELLDKIGVIGRAISGGTIELQGGTAAIPSLTSATDVATGVFFPANGVMALAAAGLERLRITSDGRLGLGTNAPSGLLDVADNKLRVRTAQTPASATAAGNQGEWAWDANFFYVCINTNTWRRAALTSW